MFSTAHEEDFKVEKHGYLMLNLLLTAIIDSWELILRDFKFEQLQECSTKIRNRASRHVSWDQDRSFKKRSKKSR